MLHDTPCPVWTGVHVADAPAVSPEFATIMCAVDRTEDSVATMRFACRLAQDNHARLFLVHAIPGAEVAPEKYFDTDLRQYLEQDARKTIAQLQETAGVAAPLCLGSGRSIARGAGLRARSQRRPDGDWTRTGDPHAGTPAQQRLFHYSDAPCPVISV